MSASLSFNNFKKGINRNHKTFANGTRGRLDRTYLTDEIIIAPVSVALLRQPQIYEAANR